MVLRNEVAFRASNAAIENTVDIGTSLRKLFVRIGPERHPIDFGCLETVLTSLPSSASGRDGEGEIENKRVCEGDPMILISFSFWMRCVALRATYVLQSSSMEG